MVSSWLSCLRSSLTRLANSALLFCAWGLRAPFFLGYTMKNVMAFLSGFGLIVLFAFSSEVFAQYYGTEQQAWTACHNYLSSKPGLEADGYYCMYTNHSSSKDKIMVTHNGQSALDSWKFPQSGACEYGRDSDGCLPPPSENNCSTDTMVGGPIMGGSDSGVHDVDGCAYECGANLDLMDGETSYYDALECVGTGEPIEDYDPDAGGDNPECVTDASGREVCEATDQNGCIVIDGQLNCPTDEAVCGEQNGAFNCVEPELEGCGLFNGERICYDPDGNKVPSDSPDHPDNGGNLDGDNANDVTDPRPGDEGGNPNNQPGDETGEGDFATEGTAREILKQQKRTNSKLDGIDDGLSDIESSIDEGLDANRGDGEGVKNRIKSDMEGAGDSALSPYDDFIEGLSEPAPMTEDDLSGVTDKVSSLFGDGQCSPLSFGIGELAYTITCDDMAYIRDMLGWLVYAFTVLRLFQIVRRPAAGREA